MNCDEQAAVSVVDLGDDVAYRSFRADGESGLACIPEPVGGEEESAVALKADGGDFLKWLATSHPEVNVTWPRPETPKVVLRSGDIWLPLVFLASDTSVQLFLNLAASYLYDRMKDGLKGDVPRVRLSAVYEDRKSRKTKRLDFSGDAQALRAVMKRFDADNFFRDAP